MRAPHVCLIEDDDIMGESLCDRLRLEGFTFQWFKSGRAALDSFAPLSFDVVLSDVKLPDLSGPEVFERLGAMHAHLPPWIYITAYSSVRHAVELLKLGASDYVAKPFDLDELIAKLRLYCGTALQSSETRPALGVSAVMRRLQELLPKLATHARTILITGESGVGKEMIAREIHQIADPSGNSPFVAVNCGALNEHLLEAELFGHEKGAFTGAIRRRPGVFEQAHGGTLFLDEIGEMSLTMQVKLLRAVQDLKITRVGGEQAIPVNLRLICATHCDLKAMVGLGKFREDLYYRIHVAHIKIPPLRERKEDILWLAEKFVRELSSATNSQTFRTSPAFVKALLEHPWPGNVRELRHALERATIFSTGPVLDVSLMFDIPDLHCHNEIEFGDTLADYLQNCERAYILQVVAETNGHIGQSAARLGISRKNLWERMKRLGLSQSGHTTPQSSDK